MITARIEGSRVIVATQPVPPPPSAVIPLPGVRFFEFGDGRVMLTDAQGQGLGQFATRALAESTIQFLSR